MPSLWRQACASHLSWQGQRSEKRWNLSSVVGASTIRSADAGGAEGNRVGLAHAQGPPDAGNSNPCQHATNPVRPGVLTRQGCGITPQNIEIRQRGCKQQG